MIRSPAGERQTTCFSEQFVPSNAQTTSPAFAAIVLAAGKSSRMGSPKSLLNLGGKPLIVRLVETISQVPGMREIQVITGHNPELIHAALHGHSVRFTHNPRHETGEMLSSIQAGVGSIDPLVEGFFVLLLDQPLVRAATLQRQMDEMLHRSPDLVVPKHLGKRGHPLLIHQRHIRTLLALSPPATLRDFMTLKNLVRAEIEVDDPGVLTDVDTPDDYQRLLAMFRASSD